MYENRTIMNNILYTVLPVTSFYIHVKTIAYFN